MSTWVFTFGSGQKYAGHYVKIEADTFGQARAKMFEKYGKEWAFQYSLEEWEAMRDNPNRWWPMETELKEE